MFLVGITASRYGLTSAQRTYLRARLTGLITEHGQVELHQGWCVGGDEEACNIAGTMGVRLVAHPASGVAERWMSTVLVDEIRPVKPPLTRNHDIVDEIDLLLAFPNEATEQVRSGTWAAVRYARLVKRPCEVVLPDGTVTS